MKKIILLITAPFIFLTGLSAQITQKQADDIVFERMSQYVLPHIIYAKDGVQQGMTITTMNGEELELDYPCWVYYAKRWFNPFVDYVPPISPFNFGRYLIVKENSGNILEVKTRDDAGPEDLETWRLIELELGTYVEISGAPCVTKIVFLDNENLVMRGEYHPEGEQYFNYKIFGHIIELKQENNPVRIAHFRIINSRKFEIQYLCVHNQMGIPPPPMIFEKIGNKLLEIGKITEIKSGETAGNTEYGLSLRVEKINDSRCPSNVVCVWAGYVPVQLHLTTKNGQYDFTLEPNSIEFKNDTIIEGMRYQLIDVSPYPIAGEKQIKTVKILVSDLSNCDQNVIISADEYENAPNGHLTIIDMKIVGDCLKIKFSASGCNGDSWVVKLIDHGTIAESNPCQRMLRLSLDNQELCKALITKEVSFNIKDLQVKEDNRIILNILDKSILYEYGDEVINLVQIGKGNLYGNGGEGIIKQNLVITDKTAWDNLLTKINSVNNESGNFTETDIDFSKYQVIAVFDEVRGNGGWSINITDITGYANEIVVAIKHTGNSPGFSYPDVVIQPYHIVKILVSDKKIVFNYAGEGLRYVKTVLGGCNTDEDLRSGSDDTQKDEVIIYTSTDSIRVFVTLNYYCGVPFETHCKIENNTIKMYITDVCEDKETCYARCYCNYTFDFQFQRKGEINYEYIVEFISPLEGMSKILSEGKIEEENTPFSVAKMTNSVNHFSMEFFATAHEELKADENIVLSPLSLNMALAMVWNGANGDTRQGIQQAMGMQNYAQEDVNNYFLDLREKLTMADPDVKLALANSIWYDNGFPVKTDFITVNKDYYNAEVKEIDFRAPDAPDQINEWCSDNTNGLIREMIDVIPSDAVMYLINALYFKGMWADSSGFDPERTFQTNFHKENGQNVLVDMMTQGREDINYYSDDHLQMVTLPYGNGAYSMVFALPKDDFGAMLLQLKQSGYWQNCLSNLKPQYVDLFIPKFKVEYEPKPDLNNILKKLGMGKAFTDSADFSGISDIRLFISQVMQKTYIEVDEKGTEAAAVTVIGMVTCSVPSHPVFFANRPFLFVIQENTTGTTLFMGKIGNP